MSSVWTRQHYNAIAKEIREQLHVAYITPVNRAGVLSRTAGLTDLALNLAKRFEKDNERFDPIRFLNACSPDVDRYPLGELWDE